MPRQVFASAVGCLRGNTIARYTLMPWRASRGFGAMNGDQPRQYMALAPHLSRTFDHLYLKTRVYTPHTGWFGLAESHRGWSVAPHRNIGGCPSRLRRIRRCSGRTSAWQS